MADERVSHEKREGNCRIVYFPGTDSESASLWNHEDCPVCRAEKAERERDKAWQALIFVCNVAGLNDSWPQWVLDVWGAARAAVKGEE
jgi:hypothetical protein